MRRSGIRSARLVHRRSSNLKLTSKENKTPPIGLPNATATPAAEAAVTISRILAVGQKGEGSTYLLLLSFERGEERGEDGEEQEEKASNTHLCFLRTS